MMDWRDRIGAYLTPAIREALAHVAPDMAARATELRLRAGRPAMLCSPDPIALTMTAVPEGDLRAMADAMLGHVPYARQEELRQGFVTLPGGYRAGLCGRAAVKDGRLNALQDIASISIRIAREIHGAADPLMPWLCDGTRLRSVLIISPPGLGKTTVLRDAARQLSGRGVCVSVVDERSELAACVRGVPTLDVGENTDVLDGCPKAEGMRLVLRAMAPRLIVTDELGCAEDAMAVRESARCGVAVLATAHARDFAELEARPMLRGLMRAKVFERIVALDGIGHVGAVYNGAGERLA